jgi:hypothetical protein
MIDRQKLFIVDFCFLIKKLCQVFDAMKLFISIPNKWGKRKSSMQNGELDNSPGLIQVAFCSVVDIIIQLAQQFPNQQLQTISY